MRHVLWHLFGWKSWYRHGSETDRVHVKALIHEVADPTARLIKTHEPAMEDFVDVIHVVRYPVDAIASYLRYQEIWNPEPVDRAAFVRREAEAWNRHTLFWSARSQPGRYVVVRYSNLSLMFCMSVWQIAESFGREVTQQRLNEVRELTSFGKLRGRSGDASFYRAGRMDNGRTVLQESECELIRALCNDGLIAIGYA